MTTHSNPEVGSSESVNLPVERAETPNSAESTGSEVTLSDRLRVTVDASRTYWTPPALWRVAPASVPKLREYARAGAWTKRLDGPLRALGVWYWRGIGLPTTLVCRYVEWFAQRPGRALMIYGLWRLFTVAGPGAWLVRNVIEPATSIANWLFL